MAWGPWAPGQPAGSRWWAGGCRHMSTACNNVGRAALSICDVSSSLELAVSLTVLMHYFWKKPSTKRLGAYTCGPLPGNTRVREHVSRSLSHHQLYILKYPPGTILADFQQLVVLLFGSMCCMSRWWFESSWAGNYMSCVHKEHAAKINIFLENNAFWQKIQQKNTICNINSLTVGAITAAYTFIIDSCF